MDWKAKEAAKAAAARAMQAAHPHLYAVSECRDGLVAAAKNIRIELGRAFPGVKFSVKSRRFSGGDAIDVRWVDGPVTKQVDRIINKYSAGHFDGQDDSYNYTADAWNHAFGDAKYVHSSRDLSDKAIDSAIRTIKARYAGNLDGVADLLTVQAYRSGALWRVPAPDGLYAYGQQNLQDLVSQTAYARTWAIDKTPAAQPMQEPEDASV